MEAKDRQALKNWPTFASIYPRDGEAVPDPLVKLVRQIEQKLGMRVLVFVQQGMGPFSYIDHVVHREILNSLRGVPRGEKIALLLHSPGGDAHSAYRIAQALRRHCGGYTVVIPHWAKSAATLLSLGADEIMLGEYAELGPLDAQIEDTEREQTISALEVVQSVERLNSEAMQAVDSQMFFWLGRSRKKVGGLLPIATRFVARLMEPLFDKIDTVEFTQFARILKIGQDYAHRLLLKNYADKDAELLAAALTKNYSDHGFVIDVDEAARIGLRVAEIPQGLEDALSPLSIKMIDGTVLGFLKGVGDEKNKRTHKPEDNNSKPSGEQEGAKRRSGRARNRNGQARPANAVDHNGEASGVQVDK